MLDKVKEHVLKNKKKYVIGCAVLLLFVMIINGVDAGLGFND
jgi:hypothetical protein